MNPGRSCLLLAAVLIFAWPAGATQAQTAQPVPDTLAQRLVACASCHARVDAGGNPVNDSYYPRIGGKPAGYLYNQLLNFREGRRQYPLMTYLVDHLPDPYLREIAGWFAAQHPPAPQPAPSSMPPQTLERGRQLVFNGDKSRNVPACVACHGQRLTGVEPSIPGLLGLPRDYVNAQFGAWRDKLRRAHAPDCMAEITARLTLEDVNAVSSWLAAQPVPGDPRPAAATSIARPLPLACGSAKDRP
ncbi:cytochrome c4 [Massilia sp. AB1]|uniref:c-type cytochrome n=1 Tax=Massilia sp. AB1 TaxID=2823371 RepID=UPI001E638096|nr:cytochrome c4 [Massilia sp. AB1]